MSRIALLLVATAADADAESRLEAHKIICSSTCADVPGAALVAMVWGSGVDADDPVAMREEKCRAMECVASHSDCATVKLAPDYVKLISACVDLFPDGVPAAGTDALSARDAAGDADSHSTANSYSAKATCAAECVALSSLNLACHVHPDFCDEEKDWKTLCTTIAECVDAKDACKWYRNSDTMTGLREECITWRGGGAGSGAGGAGSDVGSGGGDDADGDARIDTDVLTAMEPNSTSTKNFCGEKCNNLNGLNLACHVHSDACDAADKQWKSVCSVIYDCVDVKQECLPYRTSETMVELRSVCERDYPKNEGGLSNGKNHNNAASAYNVSALLAVAAVAAVAANNN